VQCSKETQGKDLRTIDSAPKDKNVGFDPEEVRTKLNASLARRSISPSNEAGRFAIRINFKVHLTGNLVFFFDF
jgi:hypothetical protein